VNILTADGTVKLVDNDYMNGIQKVLTCTFYSLVRYLWRIILLRRSQICFLFFLTKNFLETICKWSNEALISKRT
jgi:hypothetical protein